MGRGMVRRASRIRSGLTPGSHLHGTIPGSGVHVASTIDVRSASSESEQQAVIAVITLAFSADPMARWAFPDPATYLRVMPQMARAFGGNGFAHGAAHLVAGGAAAAMWLPPGVHADSERLTALTEEHAPVKRGAPPTPHRARTQTRPTRRPRARSRSTRVLMNAFDILGDPGTRRVYAVDAGPLAEADVWAGAVSAVLGPAARGPCDRNRAWEARATKAPLTVRKRCTP